MASISLSYTSTPAAPDRRTGRCCTDDEPTQTTWPVPSWSGEAGKQAHPEAATFPKVSPSLSATAHKFYSVDWSSCNRKRPEELYDLWSFFARLREKKHVNLLRQVWAPFADRASLCSPLSVCTLNRDDITVSSHTNSTKSGRERQYVRSLQSSLSCSVCTFFFSNKSLENMYVAIKLAGRQWQEVTSALWSS